MTCLRYIRTDVPVTEVVPRQPVTKSIRNLPSMPITGLQSVVGTGIPLITRRQSPFYTLLLNQVKCCHGIELCGVISGVTPAKGVEIVRQSEGKQILPSHNTELHITFSPVVENRQCPGSYSDETVVDRPCNVVQPPASTLRAFVSKPIPRLNSFCQKAPFLKLIPTGTRSKKGVRSLKLT